MVKYDNISQGTGKKFDKSSAGGWVGTNGLATCLGVFINQETHFIIGHFDCVQIVLPKDDQMYKWVCEETEKILNTTLGSKPQLRDIQVVTSSTDYSTRAIQAGVAGWAEKTPRVHTHLGFRVRKNGTGFKLLEDADEGTERVGELIFSIPKKSG